MRHILLILFIIESTFIFGQSNSVPKTSEVGVIEFFRKGHPLSFPIIDISKNDKLELRFDVFGSNEEIFNYTLELCDYNWSPVEKDPFEYIEGYAENSLEPYSNSINTLFDYVHYRLDIPNNDVEILVPGNYKIHIYRDLENTNKVLTRKFVVVKEEVRLDLQMDKYQSAIYEDKQEIKAKVVPAEASFNDLVGSIKLVVLQNNNWNSQKIVDNYSTDGKGNIVFNKSGLIVFPGANEFRFFDMKSLKFISARIDYIQYQAPNYHVYLETDVYRGGKQYFFEEDLNGLFFIGNQETHDPDTLDSEYAFVHFSLDAGVPLPSDVYLEGAITDWEMSDNYMEFNPESGNYEKVLFLKQGLYNYRYATKEYTTNYLSWDITEGSFYQTVNSYIGLLYYQPLGEIYYYPIGIGLLTTD